MATSLRFLHEVLGLDRLHYGLWQGDPPTLEGLKAAQERYSELLLSWIPAGVETILDVGAGVGTDALTLADRGYRVEALSPDPYQRERFGERTGLPFHLTRFQEFEPGTTYDLVLMSESAQYIWIEVLFDKVRQVAPGGWLLLADYFLSDAVEPSIRKSAHPLDQFERRAAEAGLRLERRRDVTEAVVPTLALARAWIERYVEPTVEIVSENLAMRYPRLHRLGGRRVRKALGKLTAASEDFDPEAFARRYRYEFLLYRVGRSGGPPGDP